MTKAENYMAVLADRFIGKQTNAKKIQKLGEEMMELAMAIAEGDSAHSEEELGDCLFILLHLAYGINPKRSIHSYLQEAAEKMVVRRTLPKSKKRKNILKKIAELK